MQRLAQFIQRIEAFLLAWSIIAIAALSIGNVFCRVIFGFSLAFTGELSQFFIIIVTFIGLSYATSRGRHIRM
ncbi:MAG: TRAP transporter small permease subunit, partial [Planctomycetota bacterium]